MAKLPKDHKAKRSAIPPEARCRADNCVREAIWYVVHPESHLAVPYCGAHFHQCIERMKLTARDNNEFRVMEFGPVTAPVKGKPSRWRLRG